MAVEPETKELDIEQYVQGHLAHFRDALPQLEIYRSTLVNEISNDKLLKPLVHSVRSRIKEEDHLAEKLIRKITKENKPPIKENELFTSINDIIGLRLLYLNRDQIGDIDLAIHNWTDRSSYTIIEGPIAMVFDDETAKFFGDLRMRTERRETLYTSVHYVLKSYHKVPYTFEIQVRTLLEEEWGEVDHSINYPDPTDSVACKEQLRTLAHFVNGCVRLVSSIMRSHKDHIQSKKAVER